MVAQNWTTPIPTRRSWRLPVVTVRSATLVAVFAILNAGDLISTWIDLHAGLREGNPLMSSLLQQYGFGALIFYKIFVVALVGGITISLFPIRPRMVSVTLFFCDLLVFAAILINVMQFPV